MGKFLSGLASAAGTLFGGGSPLIYLAIAAAIFAAGAGAGWTLNGWRLGAEVAKLEGQRDALVAENALVRNANQRCAVDVAAVQTAVTGIVEASKGLTKAANDAMSKAGAAAARLTASADEILARPPPAPGKECETIAAEQADYVRKRRAK